MVNLKRWVLLCAVLVPWMSEAQNISVQAATGQSPATFVSEQLQGSGVYIWNVKYNNSTSNINAPMIGTFQSNGYQMLQMDSGVVMTTGNVSVAPGPNNYGMTSQSVSSGYYEDTQLNQYLASGQAVTYCSTLDFDFVSISPFVTLNYCFGSEEYPNYVWTSFNDIFAFLVTGPYPSTTMKNIAIVPHTVTTANPNGIAVAINTVNGKTGTENPSAGWYHYNEFFVQNYISESNWQSGNGAQGVQYNGFTQKLSANATLIPCAQYHMHISICNVNDGAYDSGVFLEKKSFNSPWVKFYFDMGNSINVGDPCDWIDEFGADIVKLHLKDDVYDASRPWGQRMVAIGEGVLDFKKIRDALERINYNGWVVVESDFQSDADHGKILRRFAAGDPVWPKNR